MKHKKNNNHDQPTAKRHPNFLSKKFKLLLILSLILTGTGCFYLWIYNKFYISTINAYLEVDLLPINSLLDGTIKIIHVENGDYVNVGDLLIEFDKEELTNKLIEAQAGLLISSEKMKLAKFQQEQTTTAWQRNLISLQEYNAAAEEHKGARAQYERNLEIVANLEKALENIQVIANTDGWVANIPAQAGSMVKSTEKLCDVVTDQNFAVNVYFTAKELQKIKAGQKVQLIIKNFPDYIFDGVIGSENINKKSNSKLQNPVKILVNNDKFHLPISNGMQVKVRVLIGEFDNYVRVFKADR